MAITSRQVAVGTTEGSLAKGDGANGSRVLVVNRGTASVFLGPTGVSTTTGMELKNTEAPVPVILGSGEELFAIAASGTHAVHVLETLD